MGPVHRREGKEGRALKTSNAAQGETLRAGSLIRFEPRSPGTGAQTPKTGPGSKRGARRRLAYVQSPSGPPETGARLATSSARRRSAGGLDSHENGAPDMG